jgi:signal transduction histidine kinase
MDWKRLAATFNIFAAHTALVSSAGLVSRYAYNGSERGQDRVDWLQVARAEKQAAEALALAQAKTDLLAKVSHELRSPLTSILGVTEMLDYGVYGPLSREQKDAVKLVSECTQQMTRLINDLLEESRLERGAFQLEEVEFTLDDIVQRLRRQMGPAARAKDLRLTIRVAPELPQVLYGDPLRIYQVIQNLVDNAIKYTETGQIAVRFSPIDDRNIAVQVSDTGVGIPKEALAAIFDPYRQIRPSESGNGNGKAYSNGFGLGLSIVKQLVSLMDGDIRVASQVGEGSIFTVRLPVRKQVEKFE